MLISITNRCNEGCSHCLADATPLGTHMSAETWCDVVALLKTMHLKVAQVSGGEPTLHPHFFSWTYLLANILPAVGIVIESNGSFAEDATLYADMQDLLQQRWNICLQVRTHPKYYPNYERTWNSARLRSLPKTAIYNDAIRIAPLGRAAGWTPEVYYPSCANVYMVLAQVAAIETLQDLVATLHQMGKFCIPRIHHDGTIRLGEGAACTSVGWVADDTKRILTNIRATRPCNRCGLAGNFDAYVANINHWTPAEFWRRVRGG